MPPHQDSTPREKHVRDELDVPRSAGSDQDHVRLAQMLSDFGHPDETCIPSRSKANGVMRAPIPTDRKRDSCCPQVLAGAASFDSSIISCWTYFPGAAFALRDSDLLLALRCFGREDNEKHRRQIWSMGSVSPFCPHHSRPGDRK